MSILDTLFTHIAPFACVGCDTEGALLCKRCRAKATPAISRCYRCHRLAQGGRTCASCRSSSCLYAVWPAVRYEGGAETVVWYLKFRSARSAAREMAEIMSVKIAIPAEAVLVPLPTATSRARSRGYDQAELIAKSLSRLQSLPCLSALRRMGQHRQVGASRRERMAQLRGTFRVVDPAIVRGSYIVLVDDVITTGSSLEAAARELKAAGAKRVSAVVFAQA